MRRQGVRGWINVGMINQSSSSYRTTGHGDSYLVVPLGVCLECFADRCRQWGIFSILLRSLCSFLHRHFLGSKDLFSIKTLLKHFLLFFTTCSATAAAALAHLSAPTIHRALVLSSSFGGSFVKGSYTEYNPSSVSNIPLFLDKFLV